jgi:hypothetical protein
MVPELSVVITAETWHDLRPEDIETLAPVGSYYEDLSKSLDYVVTWRDPYTKNFAAGIVRFGELEKLAALIFPCLCSHQPA